MPATLRGIYHNLKESKYVISNSEITFFFSSELYLNKFIDRYKNHREEFTNKFNRIGVAENNPFNTDTLADITLYQTIEKRGFFVRLQRARINYDDLYNYALRKMNKKESLDWCRVGVLSGK
jgi:Phi-29-like late genes activator (early protein GP4).